MDKKLSITSSNKIARQRSSIPTRESQNLKICAWVRFLLDRIEYKKPLWPSWIVKRRKRMSSVMANIKTTP